MDYSSIYFMETGGDDSSYTGEDDSCELDPYSPDDQLNAVEKLEKFIDCEHSYSRQMVVRSLHEVVQQVVDSQGDIARALSAAEQFSHDSDDAVRNELMEQLPSIVRLCQPITHFSTISIFLPVIVRYLTDASSQVRKTTHAALISFVQDSFISRDDLETHVVPVIMHLAEPDSMDDFRADAVLIMTRLAPLVGSDMTERCLLSRYAIMCNDPLFHVRKACAVNFGDMCEVVGQHNTETYLLSRFACLCEDGVWGVRNACAECFVQVSRVCSMQVRRTDLTQLFVDLLCDQSRWVRLTAFQSLGAFISTFADPLLTGLHLSDCGSIVYNPPSAANNSGSQLSTSVTCEGEVSEAAQSDTCKLQQPSATESPDDFNSFQFWRIRPDVIEDMSVVDACGDSVASLAISPSKHHSSTLHAVTDLTHERQHSRELPDSNHVVKEMPFSRSSVSDVDAWSGSEFNLASVNVSSQSIVPEDLLTHYLGMVEPSRVTTVDSEILRHCAFSFPAVAYTLGRANWSCLRQLYNILARDMQWKVRRTLAFSIHHLANILGEELTCTDLVPVFDELLKDLDEVRIGLLKHLVDFLQLLKADMRHGYLTKLPEFLKTDNNRNWRLRLDLAEQLMLLIDLYSRVEVHDHILPIAFLLVDDCVYQVRVTAVRVLSRSLRCMSGDEVLWLQVVSNIKQKLAYHQQAAHRQLFLLLCSFVLEDGSMTCHVFAEHLLLSALAMHQDTVPNTRIVLARLLIEHVLKSSYFTISENPYHAELTDVLETLSNDADRDVQYIISKHLDEFPH